MNNNILVTGGLGYIGSHTVVLLQQAGYNVIIIDNCSNASQQVLEGIEKITSLAPFFYEGGITDETLLKKIFSDHEIESVIHFAAKKSVGESMELPFEYYHNNVTGTQTLLRSMDEHGVRKIIFSSTCAVYSPLNNPPYTEQMPTKPESIYGITKRINEEIIEGCVMTKKVSACILRYFNPIGNHPSGIIGEQPTQQPQNIMPIVMEVIEGEREYLSVFGDTYQTKDGTCIRDYIHVMDLAEAHISALQWLERQENIYEIINLGTGKGTSVLEIISAVEQSLHKTLPYRIIAPRGGDLPMVYGNCDKAKKLLGWSAKRSISDSIVDTWHFRNK